MWVRSGNVRNVLTNPNPALSDWQGNWKEGLNRIVIARAPSAGTLRLSGHGTWRGPAGVVHDGDFKGDVTPVGNRVQFIEDGADGCIVDLTLIGRYMVANDNSKCGGMNVRFWGIWRRAAV